MRTRITWNKFRKNPNTSGLLNLVAKGDIGSYEELLNVTESEDCRAEVQKALNADIPFEDIKRRVSGFLKRTENVQGQ